ncbi:hypothetical protein FIBSPDRAFT_929089, partial [Athelia psychrophila]
MSGQVEANDEISSAPEEVRSRKRQRGRSGNEGGGAGQDGKEGDLNDCNVGLSRFAPRLSAFDIPKFRTDRTDPECGYEQRGDFDALYDLRICVNIERPTQGVSVALTMRIYFPGDIEVTARHPTDAPLESRVHLAVAPVLWIQGTHGSFVHLISEGHRDTGG